MHPPRLCSRFLAICGPVLTFGGRCYCWRRKSGLNGKKTGEKKEKKREKKRREEEKGRGKRTHDSVDGVVPVVILPLPLRVKRLEHHLHTRGPRSVQTQATLHTACTPVFPAQYTRLAAVHAVSPSQCKHKPLCTPPAHPSAPLHTVVRVHRSRAPLLVMWPPSLA